MDDIGNAYRDVCESHANISQLILDLSDNAIYARQQDLVAQADVVLVDGPKDGRFEYILIPRLVRDMKPGSILIIDDIRFNNMQRLWRSIKKPRLDVGAFAHRSGTGMVFA